MLVRLLYASRARSPLSDADIAQLLRQSRDCNPPRGITGVLCHADGLFMQALEGGRTAVNTLYQRILQDVRHHDVELLVYEEIIERKFAGWAMGQVSLSQLNPALLLKHSEHAVVDPFKLSGRAAMAMFEDLIATASVICQP